MLERERSGRRSPFAMNPWPPFIDAMVLIFAVFVIITIVAATRQRQMAQQMLAHQAEVEALREEKQRVERRLKALAAHAAIDVEDGRVILQGEVLFDSGSAELKPEAHNFVAQLSAPLRDLLKSEPGQMVMVAGHTDDQPLRAQARYANNWDLSVARAVAVARALGENALPERSIMAAGFGPHHPRTPNVDDKSRTKNRRIEILLVPLHGVTQ